MYKSDDNFSMKILLTGCLLVIATLAAYLPALDNQFIIYDDPDYVTDNVAVLSGISWKSIVWAFTSSHSGNWHPITWLSHMFDVTLYGLDPRGHHLTSLIFHTANTLLLFTLLRQLTGAHWRSVVVTLLFALHPLHVESAVWISARKDLLSTFFLFFTLLSYYRYTLSSSYSLYISTLLLSICSLMSKQMFITLPFILLLLDWWPLNRFSVKRLDQDWKTIKKLVVEKLPFFAIAAGASLITYISHENVGTVASITPLAIFENVGRAFVTITAYLIKMLLPINLAVFYPYRPDFPSPGVFIPSILFFVAMTIAALHCRRRFPFVTFGWFWYILTILPVIGIVQIGNMSMADRYTYVPLVGPFVAGVWGASEVMARWPKVKAATVICTCLILIFLGIATFRQTRYWYNGITVFSHASIVVKDNWLAFDNLGASYLILEGANNKLNIAASVRKPIPSSIRAAASIPNEFPLQSAIKALREAIRIWPEYHSAHYNLGLAYILLGNPEAALVEYRILVNLDETLANKLLESMGAIR